MENLQDEYINGTDAYEMWKAAGLSGTYMTFLTKIRNKKFVLKPTRRVVLINSNEYKEYLKEKIKEKQNAVEG